MLIRDLLNQGTPSFSFEFFPPKTDEAFDGLVETIRELQKLHPTFVSVCNSGSGRRRDPGILLLGALDHLLPGAPAGLVAALRKPVHHIAVGDGDRSGGRRRFADVERTRRHMHSAGFCRCWKHELFPFARSPNRARLRTGVELLLTVDIIASAVIGNPPAVPGNAVVSGVN